MDIGDVRMGKDVGDPILQGFIVFNLASVDTKAVE